MSSNVKNNEKGKLITGSFAPGMDAIAYAKQVQQQNTRFYEDGIVTAKLLPRPILPEDITKFLIRYSNNITRFVLFLHLVKHYPMTFEAYAAGLRLAYTMGGSLDRNTTISCFKWLPNKFYIMTEEEEQAWNNLPMDVTLYRACNQEEADSNFYGCSWTLSRAAAEYYAWRWNEKDANRIVVQVTKNKGFMLAYFLEAGEDEVIIDIAGNTNKVEVVTKEPTQAYYDFLQTRRRLTSYVRQQ